GLHIIPIAAQLEVNNIIVPKTTATLSAFGGAVADVVREFEQTYLTNTKDFDYERVNQVLNELKEEGNNFLEKVGVPEEQRKFEFLAEARYPFQEQELTFTLKKDNFKSSEDITELENDFHHIHDAILGSKDPSENVECVVWKIRATGITPDAGLRKQEHSDETAEETSVKETRRAYFRELGESVETPIYKGDELRAGNTIIGPAIIEEPTTNLVVFPNEVVRVSQYGSYIVELNTPTSGNRDVKQSSSVHV